MAGKAPKSSPRTLTAAEYAVHRGCTKRAVNKAIAAGRCPTINGRIDPVAADAAWSRNTDPTRQAKDIQRPVPPPDRIAVDAPPVSPDRAPPFLESRARREAALAAQEELKLAERRGQLVSVEDVVREWEDRIVHARSQAYAAVDTFIPTIISAQTMDAARTAGLALLEEFLGAVSRPVEDDDATEGRKPAAKTKRR